MRILFITSKDFLPEHASGQNRTILELCRRLQAEGHQPALLCASHEISSPGGVLQEHGLGFRLIRAAAPLPALSAAVLALRPEVLVVYDGDLQALISACLPFKLPLLVWFFQVEPHYFLDTDPTAEATYMATSEFLQRRAERLFNIDVELQRPYIEHGDYAQPAAGRQVLFVNPVREKGIELLFALARQRPQTPFSVVESWGLSPGWRRRCFAQAMACGNIEWIPRSQDMRAHYRRARLLLIPRYFEEGFARLVTEAQAAGLPVLASDRGNLPDNVGPGGELLDVDAPLQQWLDRLDAWCTDEALHGRLSQQARQHSQRPQLAPDTVLRQFLQRLQQRIQAHALGRY